MPALLLSRTNAALDVNPPAGNEQLSVNGSDWLWAVTAIYAVSFLAFAGLSYVARSGEKIFHYLFTIALLVGSVTYFAQASDLGYVVLSQVNSSPRYALARQIFWPKYVNWVVSFPAVVSALGLLSGVPWATILYHVFLSWIWVVSYLVSAFTRSNYKWGFYAFGTVAWLLLAAGTLGAGPSAKRLGVSRDHTLLSGWVNLLWLLYPIAFAVTDGANTIGVTPGFIFFGVLDVLLVPALSFAFLFLARRWDYGRLNLAFTRYGRVHDAGQFPEKSSTATAPAADTPATA
ncbi:putative heat shock protein 30 [Rosellinia necatrix]|uniref:Putative heat shock protein 30 n=1 Tax=Rosellinia necatrix TaxID=77044 RepID=A0A1W2TNX5_ROSNE|nr:putative heat shock protein 30 [Rosellinia necatrix]